MRAARFVESYIDAWNHRDPRGVADHLSADGIYCDIPENVQRTRDELVTSLISFFSSHRHQYDLIGKILTSRDTIAFQYKISACNNAEKNGLPIAYCGAEFIKLHGNSAVTITDYYDIPATTHPSNPARMVSRAMQKNKYAKSGLNSEQLREYKGQLEQIMQSEQAYLRSDLTLPRLADAVNCSINHLSQVINSGFGMSFFDYLNQYRIEHAKQLLSSFDSQSNAILNIAFTVGFNSNSAFYAAFKKCVGQTPAQYRNARASKPH
jgi:AraC-like DNA-binding protein